MLKQDKKVILEELWKASRSLRARDLCETLNFYFPSFMMHLLGLKRMGYVECPEKGCYAITRKGREVLGFPELNQEFARGLLSPVPNEKAFYFFTGIGDYIGICANSLEDFCENIRIIDSRSFEFHMNRGDFENWFNGLGDTELARKISLLKTEDLNKEELRKVIYQTVRNRCKEMKAILS